MYIVWFLSFSVIVIVGETKQRHHEEIIGMQSGGGFMFNVSHLILQSVLFCGGDIVCDKSLLNVFSIPKEPGSGTTRCGKCSCSENCLWNHTLQNCCPDVFFKHGLRECRDVNILSKETILKEVVASCPVGTSLTLSRECTKQRLNVDTLLHPPVSSETRNVSYLNKYCAICNQETNWKKWNAMFECPDPVDFNFLSSYKEIMDLATQQSCSLLYKSPHSAGKCYNENYGKLTSCNVTGSWLHYDEQVEQGCISSYYAPMGIFKNIFCAMCNPPLFQANTLIDKCDNSISIYKEACSVLPILEASFPHKNFFCFACNHDEYNTGTRYYTDIDFNSAEEEYIMDEKDPFQFEIKFSYIEKGVEEYIHQMNSESDSGHLISDSLTIEDISRKKYQFKCPIIHRNWSKIDREFEGEHGNPYKNIEMEQRIYELNTVNVITTFPEINITNLIRMSFALSRHGTCTPGLLPNYTIPLQKPCSCTLGCRLDCCDDFALKVPWTCIPGELYGDQKGKGKKYLAIGECNEDTNIEHLCTNNETLHFYQTFPVTSKHGNKESYANFFCYLCNIKVNDRKYTSILEKATQEVTVWPLKVKCSEYVNYRNFYSLQSIMDYLKQIPCDVGFVPQSEASECKDACNLENFYTIGKCNISGTWSVLNTDIFNACEYSENFRFPPVEVDGTIYKNKFCAICNPFELKHTDISCREAPENSSIVKACQEFPDIDVCFPYSNIFCEMCLKNSSKSPCYVVIDIDKVLPIFTINPPIVPTSTMLPTADLWTFRSTFSLGEYDVSENEILPTCQDNHIFDDFQQICRNLTCFPGKVKRNKTCVSLLAVTSMLRYTLAVKIEISVLTVINATVQALMERIRSYITEKLKVEFSPGVLIEQIGLMSSVSCEKRSTELNEVFLYLKIFVDGLVNRDEMEQNLIDFTESSADWNLSKKSNTDWMLSVKVSRHHQSLSLFLLQRVPDVKNHCFIISDDQTYRSEIHKNVYVSPLLTCPQFILKNNESDLVIAGVAYPFVKSSDNNSHFIYSGQLRMCVEIKESLTSENDNLSLTILTILCLVISLICLFLTFLTYCMFSGLRTLPGINNMCLVVSLFSAQFLTIVKPSLKSTFLSIASAVSHFSWLSTFLWLQVCSFHMFRVFNAKGRSEFSGRKSKKITKFYALYAFGSSAVIVITNIIVSLIVTNGANSGYDNESTLMTYKTAFIVTLIVPLILICTTNIMFYISTVYKIHSTPKLEKTSGNRIHVSVYVKLFTLTGLSWMLQIIDTFFNISVLSYFVAVLNGLQGLFIFVSYICNERVLKMYHTVCCKISGFQHSSTKSSNIDTTRI